MAPEKIKDLRADPTDRYEGQIPEVDELEGATIPGEEPLDPDSRYPTPSLTSRDEPRLGGKPVEARCVGNPAVVAYLNGQGPVPPAWREHMEE